jgi:ankyrin repeat protein/serine/threonine protein kinase
MIFGTKNKELLEASEKGDVEKVKELLKEGANINAKNKFGYTPLHVVADRGHIEIVKLLIEHGADVNAKDNIFGHTPLHKAAYNGHIEIVKLLIEHGADVNAKDIIIGVTPLHYAAYKAHIEIVKLLIEHGADVNAKDTVGFTPLHDAAGVGYINVVKLLIEHGADVNAKTNYGWTPLHLAASECHIEVARLLLEHGADPNIKNNEGKTVIDLALEKGYSDIVKLIEEFKSFKILNIEAPKLFVNEWGKIIVKVKGKGKISLKLKGDVNWKDPGSKELSGESNIEIPIKPKVSGEVPVNIIIDTPYGKESSIIFLKVEKKEEKPIQPVTPAIIKETLPGLNDIIPLRNIPLGNLVSGYGCSSKRFKVNLSIPIVPKEFEGAWNCCLLGCGGWGCAYLCIRGENKVVIKIPRGFEAVIEGNIEAPTGHEAFLKKIKSEAEIMGSLNHPNIIKLLGISNKLPLVIYEFADYGSLYWQLNKGWKPSIKDILLIGIQIGDALRYIHYRGLIHGDIKPSNIFIKDKIAKLGDFSSTVKLLSSVSISKMVYTIGFRAPEQVFSDIRRKAKELGVESKIDVYQLGNLLLYISTGESIDGEEAIDDKLVMEKLSKVPNEDLKQILSKTLVLEPEKRPSAEDLTKMLYTVWNKL